MLYRFCKKCGKEEIQEDTAYCKLILGIICRSCCIKIEAENKCPHACNGWR